MTAAHRPEDHLRAAAEALQGEQVSMQTLLAAHGPGTHGTLLVLVAVPCMLPIPGTGSVLGWGLLALALAMWRNGRDQPLQLPARVAGFQMSHSAAQRVLLLLARFYSLAGRLSRERLTALAHDGHRFWLAPKVAVMAVLIILPIPFGNVLPGIAVVLLGLGLAFRDGLAVLLSGAAAALALAFTAALGAGVWQLGAAWGA